MSEKKFAYARVYNIYNYRYKDIISASFFFKYIKNILFDKLKYNKYILIKVV